MPATLAPPSSRPQRYFAAVLCLLAAGLFVPAWPRQAPQTPDVGPATAIHADQMRQWLYFIASDTLAGRSTPSRGLDIAALFIASKMSEWGLQPAAPNPAAQGPLEAYFLPIALSSAQLDPTASSVSLNGRTYKYGRDFVLTASAIASAADISASMVFAGDGYVFSKNDRDPYRGLDVRGKIVLIAGNAPALFQDAMTAQRAGRPAASGAPDIGTENTDWFSPQDFAVAHGALAVVTCANLGQFISMLDPVAALRMQADNAAAAASKNPSPTAAAQAASLAARAAQADAEQAAGHPAATTADPNGPSMVVTRFFPPGAQVPALTAGPVLLNAIFAGEPTGTSAIVANSALPAGHNDSFALNAAKLLTLHLQPAPPLVAGPTPPHMQDVLAILPGSDPVLKNEYVAVSAHYDHLGLGPPLADGHTVFNGADDDGSGTVALLAMAQAFAHGPRPRRSLLFIWHAGEEKGLWGSQYLAQFPPFPMERVVADLNMDMIGRSRPSGDTNPADAHLAQPGEVFVLGPDIESAEMGRLADAVNAGFLHLSFNHYYDRVDDPERAFYRSDHFNYARLGIPIIFFTTGLHADYHKQTDTPDKIDYHQMEQVSQTVAALAWRLAQQPARVQLNPTLPPALAAAMKTSHDQGWGVPHP